MSGMLDFLEEGERLPEPLPGEPMMIARRWLDEAAAAKQTPDPNAMTLATVDADGGPSARVVLCREMNAEKGYVVFYTNYLSEKGRALSANPRAALCFHWNHANRQVRLRGPVTRSPDAESDAYFAKRSWESRLGAWASRQSEPLAGRGQLLEQAAKVIEDLRLDVGDLMTRGEQVTIPRPPHWGGYRVWAQSVELWVGGAGRLHDRAKWTRGLAPAEGGFKGGAWKATRLQP